MGQLVHRYNLFCSLGTQITNKYPLSYYNNNIAIGKSVRLCHGNKQSICSAYVTVTSGTATPECFDGVDNADHEDTLADTSDPGCYSNGNVVTGTYTPSDTDETHAPACMNGVIDTPSEQCDDGNTLENDACSNYCRNAICGDGNIWNQAGGTEQCDDMGECSNGAFCRKGYENCGDGSVCEPKDGDGCSASCQNETAIDLELLDVWGYRWDASPEFPGQDYGNYVFSIRNNGTQPVTLTAQARIRSKEDSPSGDGAMTNSAITNDMIQESDRILESGENAFVTLLATKYNIPKDQELIKAGTFDVLPAAGYFDTNEANNTLHKEVIFAATPTCDNDGMVEGAEQCDDGNASDDDFCSAECTIGQDQQLRLSIAGYTGDPQYIEWEDIPEMLFSIWEYNRNPTNHDNRVGERFDFDQNENIDAAELDEIELALSTTSENIIDPLYEFFQEMMIRNLDGQMLVIESFEHYERVLTDWGQALVGAITDTHFDVNKDGSITYEDYVRFVQGMSAMERTSQGNTEHIINQCYAE